jgi:hypothetical protein
MGVAFGKLFNKKVPDVCFSRCRSDVPNGDSLVRSTSHLGFRNGISQSKREEDAT